MKNVSCFAAVFIMLNCINMVSAAEPQPTEGVPIFTLMKVENLFGRDPTELYDFLEKHRDTPSQDLFTLRTRTDVERFIEKLENSAKHGDIASLRVLGWIYHSRKFANYDKAFMYYSMAARAGDAVSARLIGDAYHSGDLGVKPDSACALGWYEVASNLGDTQAKVKELQVLWGPGNSPPFPERAFALASELSIQGDSQASAWMAGIMNYPAMLRNVRRAFHYAITSARSGNRLGLGHLSQIVLEHCESLTKDELWQAYRTLKKCDYNDTQLNAAIGLLQINNIGENEAEIAEGHKRLLSASDEVSGWAALRLAQAICDKKIAGSISEALKLTKLAANRKNMTACWILLKSRCVDQEAIQWLDEFRNGIGDIDAGLVRMIEILKRA